MKNFFIIVGDGALDVPCDDVSWGYIKPVGDDTLGVPCDDVS